MGEISYRKATANDLEALARLRYAMQAERQPERASEPGQWDTYLAAYHDAFADQIARGGFDAWLAEDGSLAVSCVVLLWWRTPPVFDQLVRRRGMVSSVYTLPEYRRQGIARELMRMLITQAKKLQIRRLVLWASEMGRPLYEDIGFEPSQGMELDAIEFTL
jgi:GNAT superfamily N-acetyltransferase